MTTGAELRARFQVVQEKRVLRRPPIPAQLGKTDGTVDVAGKPHKVWVRPVDSSVAVQVFNFTTQTRADMTVWIGYTALMPSLLQVLGQSEVYAYAGQASPPQVGAHHLSHEWNAAGDGSDVVWVQKPQIMPMLCYVASGDTLTVTVEPDIYPWDDGFQYFERDTQDMTASIPANAGEARYSLVSIDGATNALQVTDGDVFAAYLPPLEHMDKILSPPVGSVPVGAIYLPNGVTQLTQLGNIWDIRMFNQPVGGSVLPGVHGWLNSTVHTGTATGTPVRGDVVVANDTPAFARVAVGSANEVLTNDGTDAGWSAGAIDLTAGKTLVVGSGLTLDGADNKTLTVEDDSLVDQDLTADASPTLAGLTLSGLGAGAVQADGGGALSSGALPLTDLASYAEGALMIGGAGDWETLAIGAALARLRVNAGGTAPEWVAEIDLGHLEPLVDGDPINPELLFTAEGDVVMGWVA